MRRIFVPALLVALASAVGAAQTDPLSPLLFLVGEWQAIDTPPGETGSFTFKPAVQDRIIVRTNEAHYAATKERPASRHDDLLVIYVENGSIKADYFDSENHVIRYAVQASRSNHAVFVSDPSPGEPRYRLSYTAGADGILLGAFEIAQPGTPDTFKPYLSWKARKR